MDGFNVPKKVNRHVLKAINFLSNGKLGKPIHTSAILNQVKYQMRNLVPVPNIDMAVQKSLQILSGTGLIERSGRERYAFGRHYAEPPQGPSSSSRGRRILSADSRKRSRSALNPNINRTYKSEESLSGDEFDRKRPQGPSSSSRGRIILSVDSRKRSRSALNPNINRTYKSEESLSGDEFDRKRPQGPSSSSRGRIILSADSRKRSRSALNPNINRTYKSEESLSGDEFDRTRKRLRSNNKKINYSGREAELPKARHHIRHYDANDDILDNPIFPPGISGEGYFSVTALNRYPVTSNFIGDSEVVNSLNKEFTLDSDPALLDVLENNTDNSDPCNNLQIDDKISNQYESKIIELYRNSKSNIKISNSSIANQRDVTTNNSANPSSEALKSPSVTAEKSNLVEDSISKTSKSNLVVDSN